MNTNIFKKIYLFFLYRKNLLKAETELKIQFNIRIDNIFRFYTVLNIPKEIIEEPYNIRKSDVDTMSQNYLREFNNQLSLYLNQKGLTELYKIYDMEKVDKYSYLIVFGFSFINTKRFANSLLYFWTPLTILTIISILTYIIIN
jgi:hypothetical protein